MMMDTSEDQTQTILGAMLTVATAGGGHAPSDIDKAFLQSAFTYTFRGNGELDVAALPPVSPDALAGALPSDALREHATGMLAVTTLVDGVIDEKRIEAALAYASALDVHEDYLTELAAIAKGRLHWAMTDMVDRNIASVSNQPWFSGDAVAWLIPYQKNPDPTLEARYQTLSSLPEGSFGRDFWVHYDRNGYFFPGNPQAANETFIIPHDSTHVLSGYDTTPRGEILVSTFTAGMHKKEAIAGHILPVLISWHLGIKILDFPGSADRQLDPRQFWDAWERGSKTTQDTFAADWDFWSVVETPTVALRQQFGVIPKG